MSQHLVNASGFVRSYLGQKQITILNWERYSDHHTWWQVSSFVVAKYSRFLWSVTTSTGIALPSRYWRQLLSTWLEDTILRLESPMQRFWLQGGRTWLQLLRSCTFPRQGVLFQAEVKSSCGNPNGRSNKSENRNSREFTQEMRGDLVESFVVRLGRY